MTTQTTLNSFVNRWECDENDHLNVQFYFSRFEEADRQFQLLTGLSEALVGARRVRHVRFHKELRVGALISVKSSIAFDGPHLLTVVHEMVETGSGILAATAVDGYEPSSGSVKALRQRFKEFQTPMNEDAHPRGLPTAPASPRTTLEGILSRGAETCFLGTVLPHNIGADGRADDRFALACCTDGVPHVWQRTPLTQQFLQSNGYGRVAAEMKLSWAGPLKSGDMVHVVTGFTAVTEKTFSMRHHLFESRTKRLAATLDVVALMMDLSTRAAVPLPEEASKSISRAVIT